MKSCNDCDVSLELGEQYYYGKGVEKDYKKAFEIFSRLAELGNEDAECYLGLIYRNGGYGCYRSIPKAYEIFGRLAELGHAKAQYNLGDLYSSFYEGKGSYIEAIKWYEKAADQGYVDAYRSLGFIYTLYGSHHNCAKAIEWYTKASELGDKHSMIELAEIYKKGEGVPRDYLKAAEWYRKAAEQGSTIGQIELAEMYLEGKGVPQDCAEAVKWFRRAAEQDICYAQGQLGQMYYNGLGVKQDYVEAAKWFEKASNAWGEEAPYFLGLMYEEGKGVPRDYYKAVEWYKEAIDNCREETKKRAKESLKLLYKKHPELLGGLVKYILHCDYPGAEFREYIYASDISNSEEESEELDEIIRERLEQQDFEKFLGKYFTEEDIPACGYVCYDEIRVDVFGNSGVHLNEDIKIYLDTVNKKGKSIKTKEINIEDYIDLDDKHEFLMECGYYDQTDEYIEISFRKFVEDSEWSFGFQKGDNYIEDVADWPAPKEDGSWIDKDGNTLKPCMWFGNGCDEWVLDGDNLDFWLSDRPELDLVEVHYDAYPNYGGGIPGFEEVIKNCPVKIEVDDTPESIDKKIQDFFVEQYKEAHK